MDITTPFTLPAVPYHTTYCLLLPVLTYQRPRFNIPEQLTFRTLPAVPLRWFLSSPTIPANFCYYSYSQLYLLFSPARALPRTMRFTSALPFRRCWLKRTPYC